MKLEALDFSWYPAIKKIDGSVNKLKLKQQSNFIIQNKQEATDRTKYYQNYENQLHSYTISIKNVIYSENSEKFVIDLHLQISVISVLNPSYLHVVLLCVTGH